MTKIDNGIYLTQVIFYCINFANFFSIINRFYCFWLDKEIFVCWLDPSKTVRSLAFCQCSERHIIRRVNNVIKYCECISLNCFIAYQRTVGVNGSPSLWLSFDMHGGIRGVFWLAGTQKLKEAEAEWTVLTYTPFEFLLLRWFQANDFDYIFINLRSGLPRHKIVSLSHRKKWENMSVFSFANCVNCAACECVYYHYTYIKTIICATICHSEHMRFNRYTNTRANVSLCWCTSERWVLVHRVSSHINYTTACVHSWSNIKSLCECNFAIIFSPQTFSICIIHCVRIVTGNYRQRSAAHQNLH